MEIALIWLFFTVAIGAWARNKGRSFLFWFVAAVIFTPIVAAIVLMILPSRDRGTVAKIEATLTRWTDAMDRKANEMRTRRREEAIRSAEARAEAIAPEFARLNLLIDEQANQNAVARASHPAPGNAAAMRTESFQPSFGKRRT
jgi:hypothetical protein